MNQIQEKIIALKKEKNAIILAHNYQNRKILEVADYIGDSLYLSQRAMAVDADIIVFCGVHFMAESAKLLNKDKKVLLPNSDAGCFMADRIDVDELVHFKKDHPSAAVVSYVNTTAEVKSETDICCTSANSVEVVESLPNNEIIFIPDRNLAAYVQLKTSKKIIPWDWGYCFLHEYLSEEKLNEKKVEYPDAEIIMHPETPLKYHKFADKVAGTGGMFKYVGESEADTFLVATEENMCGALSLEFPNKTFIPLMRHCVNMAKITLENTLEALEKEQFEVNIDEGIFDKAKESLVRMIEL